MRTCTPSEEHSGEMNGAQEMSVLRYRAELEVELALLQATTFIC